ncbi:HAMP domain-containing protein [Nostoc sp. CENA67]|uniref:histidine kinase n=1 Tax=Amazonocrinis nigriterrae CENA67 TaxID=2794033 RepID=A0A8J7HXX8_9NOST|nr:cache domain-containing protein [Amazonocrinis nigriterrae]MBH8566355.1 HAMP domain-containing protein [Amazonocrinis nigriterrae CENA67]
MVNKNLFIQALTNISTQLSLRTVLIVPFILQISAAVGLTGYLSLKNGQKAVNDVAAQLQTEISRRVEQNLKSYLEPLHNLNQANEVTISIGELDIQNTTKLEHYFFEQLKIFDGVNLIGFANLNRELFSAERYSDGSLTIRESSKSTGYELRTYRTNSKGNRLNIIDSGKNYNPQKRDWYQKPLQTGKQSWSEIYPHVTGSTLYIAASQPIYNRKGKLVGVLLSNLNLLQIGAFLKSLKIGKKGQSFIIERSGMLVATSTKEKPFQFTKAAIALPEKKVKRLLAKDSSDVMTQAIAKYLETKFGNFNSIKSEQQLDFKINGKRQFIQVLPFQDHRKLDWLIVVVVPEDDFMEKINTNTRTTILLCIIALIVAVAVGVLILRWITQPIITLKESALALTKGEWEKRIEIKRSDELGELAKSFNSMAHQLQIRFVEMQDLNKALLQSERCLKQFLEAVPVGISIHDSTGQLYYANRITQQLLGIEILAEVESEQLAEFYQIYLAESDQLYATAQLPIMRSLAGETVHVDNLELHQDNKIIPLEVFSTPIFDETGKLVYAIAASIDITERKQAQKLLADYNSILEQQVAERTQELQQEIAERSILTERNRLAQEIHDTLAQAFAVVIVHLDTASRKLTTDIEAAQALIKAGRDLAHSGLTEARRSIKALRSQLLEDGDIFYALNRFATQMFSSTNTHIVCQLIGEIYPLPPDVENNLFRIGQEALTNAFKYAKAGEIQIELAYQERQCSLRIKDDGQGFDMNSVSIINSFGLLVMSERAERIGAKLTIQSSPGQGTEVSVLVYRE